MNLNSENLESICAFSKSYRFAVAPASAEDARIHQALGLPDGIDVIHAIYDSYRGVPGAKHIYGIRGIRTPHNRREIPAVVAKCRFPINTFEVRKLKFDTVYNEFRSEPFSTYSYYSDHGYAVITATIDNQNIPIIMLVRDAMHLFDFTVDKNLTIWCNGNNVGRVKIDNVDLSYYYSRFDSTYNCISRVADNLLYKDNESRKNIARNMLKLYPFVLDVKAGITKCFERIHPFALNCIDSHPEHVSLFYALADDAKKTENGVKHSVLFNSYFENVTDAASFIDACESLLKTIRKDVCFSGNAHAVWENIPKYKEQRKKALASQGNRAFTKIMQEFDNLKLDEAEYPKISALIKSGRIPLTTFFTKKEQYFLVNDNWELWEDMLNQGHEEAVVELAQEVAKRTTYEKDLMSYFYFILYDLPLYLRENTGKTWKCFPRHIESATELEPPSEDSNGITKSRSALTPIVDNEKNTVIVPYASFGVSGRQTTYCYSHTYSILRAGFSFNGNVCTKDIETALNGKDDYGLMFYTLTGSYNNRGFPTFLIIFEQRDSGTFVHFHRTHPCRSKDGDYNPIHNWIKVCYNWMVGNVNASRIAVQQGDLVFVKVDPAEAETLNFDKKVEKYDNHFFDRPVQFAEYTKKDRANILGYVKIDSYTVLDHHEHMPVRIPCGTYCVRQCRSWEANPRGIWSLRID